MGGPPPLSLPHPRCPPAAQELLLAYLLLRNFIFVSLLPTY